MAINVSSAINAYRSAAASATESMQSSSSPKLAGTTQSGGTGFSDLIKDSLKEAVAVQRNAEEISLKGIAGDADMRDVVLAVNNAENTLNTVVAIRDKVLNAYQEILKMPI
ncbi:flagellar hook-basal body complex protein FliE [Novispirillum itersonii]|uniref:flagellar hook-basal body complex protein FliE n=1 Tax=Novispirillum itersonii TaxID=189 RepID=UPI00037529C9|nr:flagellar hook-basal body complex protein FliE [Novispirillum itersonii]